MFPRRTTLRQATPLGLAVLLAQALAAQVTGTVVDPAGGPIPDVLVELWGPSGRLAGFGTNSDGRFAFSAAVARGATVITARRIGYGPQRVAVESGPMTIMLLPFAVELPALADTAGLTCPIRDQREARVLWSTMAQQFRPFDLAGPRWSDARVAMGVVQPAELGVIDTAWLGPGGMAAGGSYYEQQTERIRRRGYAVAPNGLRTPRFDAWEYPYLESLLAGHFLDHAFAEQNNLALATNGADTVIVFCPRDSRRPGIEGRIRLSRSRGPASATWRFRTSGPEEEAGGEVMFGLNPDAEVVPLIGLFWRKRVFDYYQEWWEFREWKSCETEPTNRRCRR